MFLFFNITCEVFFAPVKTPDRCWTFLSWKLNPYVLGRFVLGSQILDHGIFYLPIKHKETKTWSNVSASIINVCWQLSGKKNVIQIHTVENLLKKKMILSFVTTEMDLDNAMLSELSHT